MTGERRAGDMPPEAKGKPQLSADKALVTGIAGRYAVALYDLAEEGGLLEEVEGDLAKVAALLEQSDEFSGLVGSPLLSRAQQAAALETVADHLDLGALTRKFLGVLAANRRLGYLAQAIAGFQKLLAHKRGEVTAEVTSAQPLSEAQNDALKASLKAAVGREVTFDKHVDESLLGGLVIKIGSRMVDSSLKTKLQNLKVSMKEVG